MSRGIEFYAPFNQIICPTEVNRSILFAAVSHIISHRQPYYFVLTGIFFPAGKHRK